MNRSDKKGFTLVEMIIAISIFAILVAISIPTFRTFLAQRRLNGAARELQSNLMAVRMQAVVENKWLALNISNNHQYIIFRDDNKNGTVDSNEIIATKDFYPPYYDVAFAGSAGKTVTFYPNGTSSSDTLCVTGVPGLMIKKITVSSNGRVKLEEAANCP